MPLQWRNYIWQSLAEGTGKRGSECVVGVVLQSLHHHYQSLGGWTFAFDDYYQLNITLDLDHPKTQQLADIVNPYGQCGLHSLVCVCVCVCVCV